MWTNQNLDRTYAHSTNSRIPGPLLFLMDDCQDNEGMYAIFNIHDKIKSSYYYLVCIFIACALIGRIVYSFIGRIVYSFIGRIVYIFIGVHN